MSEPNVVYHRTRADRRARLRRAEKLVTIEQLTADGRWIPDYTIHENTFFQDAYYAEFYSAPAPVKEALK